MKRLVCLALMGFFVTLTGCAKSKEWLPPVENEYVTVTVKVPLELRAEPVQVMYRSNICKQATYDSNGNRSDVDGYHGFDTSFQRKGETDLYEMKLPRNGGGECQWNLSNITFEVAHSNPSSFGADVFSGGGGVVVIFDANRSSRGGADYVVKGDLRIKKDYYPWVFESFLGTHRIDLSLFGDRYGYLKYQALTASDIYFEPVLHSRYVLRSVGPKFKKKGDYIKHIYPDGSIFAGGVWPPSFSRLQTIRQVVEVK